MTLPSPPAERPSRPRTASRVAAVQALFQAEQADQGIETVLAEFIRHRLGDPPGAGGFAEGRVPHAEVALFSRILRAAAVSEPLDREIAAALPPDWPLPRLDPVLRALLRAAVAELGMADGPPAKVVINEYLDIAHGFLSEEAGKLANGVLNRISRAHRPSEFL
jgi:N utilization substance protein B